MVTLARSHLGRLLLVATIAAASQGLVQPTWAADQLAIQATQRLRLKGCGKHTDQIDVTLRIEDAPTWDLDLGAPPPGGSTLAGSYTVAGRGDRKVTLQSDAVGVATLTARIGALATELCGSATGADGVEIKAFKLVRGKKAARLKLTAKFTATTGKRGKLTVRGKGVLTGISSTTSTTMLDTTSTVSSTTTITSTTSITSSTKPSTTVTTSSSTTTSTVFNECLGVADGVGCLDDGNICTRDLCIGETCTHTTPQVGFQCRPANGSPCDVADTCLGLGCPDMKSTGACPGPVLGHFKCHEGLALVCNGASDECPAEQLCTVGAPCNEDEECTTGICVRGTCAAGPGLPCAPCDTAPDCESSLVCASGVCTDPTASPCCDVNANGALLPAGTSCRPAAGLCDVEETCTGSSPYCPPDALVPVDTICRPLDLTGCDDFDRCTGTSAECPEIVLPAGTLCGGVQESPCDPAQFCNGVSKGCPLSTYGQCQQLQGPCDVLDSCAPGSNPNFPECPDDTVAPAGTVCEPPPGSVMSDCQEYICDGTDYLCDQVRNRGTTYPCRPAVDECDVAELCGSPAQINPNYNPEFPSCPSTDLHQPDGTPCTTAVGGFDGTCQGGTCVENLCKYDVDCPDGEVCNTSTWHCIPKAVGTGQGAPCTGVSGSIVANCTGDTFCCAGMEGDGVGSYAGAGEAGRCAECCGNQQSTIDDCADPEDECCDGRCINVGTSIEHCGGCTPGSNAGFGTGVDCRELENGCYRNSTCFSGECLFTSQCTEPGDYCSLPRDPNCPPDVPPLFCFGGESIDPLCTSGWPDFPGCAYGCNPDPLVVEGTCLNFGCESDADCCDDLVCRTTCTVRDYGFCFQGTRTCQVP